MDAQVATLPVTHQNFIAKLVVEGGIQIHQQQEIAKIVKEVLEQVPWLQLNVVSVQKVHTQPLRYPHHAIHAPLDILQSSTNQANVILALL